MGLGSDSCQTVSEGPLGLLSSARQRGLPYRHEPQPRGSVGQALPHPSFHLRLRIGKEGQKPLWALGLELCWNQLRVGQSSASEAGVSPGSPQPVHALPSASNHRPTQTSFHSCLLQPCSLMVGTWLLIRTPSGQGYPTAWLHWRQLDFTRGTQI